MHKALLHTLKQHKYLTVLLRAFLVIIAVIIVAGCSKRFHSLPAFSAFPIGDPENQSVGRFKTSYLADQIHAYYNGYASGPLAVSTFVDINNLYGSSAFGRILSEQILSELSMKGYKVVEIRQSDVMQIMSGQGEFGMSRDANLLRPSREVSGIIVGTYAVSPVRVYINARLIDPATSIVQSAGTVELELTKEIEKLLRSSTLPPTLERLPIRQMGQPNAYGMSPWLDGPWYPDGTERGSMSSKTPPTPKIDHTM